MSIDTNQSTAARFSGMRNRLSDGTYGGGVRYPSPFFDIGHTYLPPTVKSLLRWCRYYYLVNPLINAVIHKMSEYPVTELVIDEKNVQVKEKWEELLGTHLRYRAFQIEVGLDYHTYGICLTTIHFPFTKWLTCSVCGKKEKASASKYRWRNLSYVLECKKCGTVADAKVQDYYERDVRRIRLMRWNPEFVHVDPGFAGADPIYTFEIPLQIRNDILIGKKNVLDTVPDVYIEAMKRNKFIRFTRDNLFVFRRPIISQKDNGWGMPLIFPVLKDTFYLQILRKAQEQIAQEHIVPLRILFPQAAGATSDPYMTTDLGNWRGRIESEIQKWKYDQNYMPILPLPVGTQTIGGDGKALLLNQEMDAWSKQIVAGMGVPQEFVYGGLQYSGSNVSMRMIENQFIGYRTDHHLMLNQFVIKKIAAFMGWPVVRAHMRRFKMADDLQRMNFYFQLNQAQKISDQTLLQECDLDPAVEEERKKLELNNQLEFQRKMQLTQANIQGQASLVQAKFQAQAQQLLAPPPPPDPATVDPATSGVAMGEQFGSGQGGGDPAAQGQPGAMPGQPEQEGGQQGEMVPGQQVNPGMPAGSTVSLENAQQAPTEGIPQEMQSPLTMGTKGGGANLLYLARRAATHLESMDELGKNTELDRMKMAEPQLYSLVLQLLRSSKGSQENPLDAVQSPLPQQRPSRRAASVGT